MKRLWIALAIILAILGAGGFGLGHLLHVTEEMQQSLDGITEAIDRQDAAAALSRSEDFQHQWQEIEKNLLRYIHHEALDTVDGVVARLPALAKFEDYPELAAEIGRLKELIDHICDAEIPSLRNIM